MVTNDSSLGDDWNSLKSWVDDKAQAAGRAVGLVDELIPGDAPATGEVAEHLTKLGSAFERAGQGFKAIDTGSWQGQAAEAAGGYLSAAPRKWLNGADAFERAGKAIVEYQRVLAEMQGRAARAKEELDRAEKAGEAARETHNAKVAAFNASDRTGPRPGEFHDPTADDRAAAQQAIADAKAAVKEAAQHAAKEVRSARQGAPAEPGFMSKLTEQVVDGFQMQGSAVGDIAGGALGAVHEMGQLARMVQPFDPYKFTHPHESAEAMATLAMGVVGSVADPYGAAKTVVDIDGWRNNPAKAAGSMVPDALMSLAGGAGVAGRVARGVGKVSKGGDELAETGGKLAGDTPTPNTPEPTPKTDAFGEPTVGANPWEAHQPEGWSRLGDESTDIPDQTDPTRVPGDDTPLRPSEMNSDGPPQQTGEPLIGRDPVSPTARPESVDGPRSWQDDGVPGDPGTPDGPGSPGHLGDGPPQEYRGDPDFKATAEDHQAMREIIGDSPGQQRLLDEIRMSNPDIAHIPDEELAGMKRYTEIHHQDWNEALRGGDPAGLEKHDVEIKNAVSGMNKLPDWQPEPGQQLYRGIDVAPEKLDELLERYKTGEVVEEAAFTSADKANPFPGNVQFVIDEPQHAKDLEFLNPHGGMKEAGWLPGSQFEVGRVVPTNRDGTEWEIHLRDRGR